MSVTTNDRQIVHTMNTRRLQCLRYFFTPNPQHNITFVGSGTLETGNSQRHDDL